jgi:hypothetical protein
MTVQSRDGGAGNHDLIIAVSVPAPGSAIAFFLGKYSRSYNDTKESHRDNSQRYTHIDLLRLN